MIHGEWWKFNNMESKVFISTSSNFIPILLGGFVFLGLDLLSLGLLAGNALFSAPSRLLVLGSSGLRLIGQLLGAKRFRLLLVDELHQDALVLENVTLALDVELVVKMAIDLLVFSVLFQQTTQDSHPPHPQLLDGHAGVGGTLALSGARVTTLTTREGVLARASARVNGLRLLDDQTVLDQPTDVLSGIGVGDLRDFVGIHPHLIPSALHHRGRQPLLQPHGTHLCNVLNLTNRGKSNTKI